MITIQPVVLADVRHLGPDDIISGATISNVTRTLDQNDRALAAKINEVASDLGSFTLPVPIVIPRFTLQAGGDAVLGNLRIPTGFQATIIEARVASNPLAGQAVLHIFHSAGTFGQTGTGNGVTELVSTTDEFNLQGQFVGEGEFIFTVSSNATKRLDVAASILVALKS